LRIGSPELTYVKSLVVRSPSEAENHDHGVTLVAVYLLSNRYRQSHSDDDHVSPYTRGVAEVVKT